MYSGFTVLLGPVAEQHAAHRRVLARECDGLGQDVDSNGVRGAQVEHAHLAGARRRCELVRVPLRSLLHLRARDERRVADEELERAERLRVEHVLQRLSRGAAYDERGERPAWQLHRKWKEEQFMQAYRRAHPC